MAVDYVCLIRLVSDGLSTCEVEEIVEGAGVTVGGGGGIRFIFRVGGRTWNL